MLSIHHVVVDEPVAVHIKYRPSHLHLKYTPSHKDKRLLRMDYIAQRTASSFASGHQRCPISHSLTQLGNVSSHADVHGLPAFTTQTPTGAAGPTAPLPSADCDSRPGHSGPPASPMGAESTAADPAAHSRPPARGCPRARQVHTL